MSLCSSCHATIRWAKTPAGKNTPLDEQPAADGPLWLDNGIARFVEDDTPDDVARYNPALGHLPERRPPPAQEHRHQLEKPMTGMILRERTER